MAAIDNTASDIKVEPASKTGNGGNMEPSDYKHVALGLIFLKYLSDTFEARHTALLAEGEVARGQGRVPDRQRVLGAEGGALVASASERQAADHRHADRRRDARHREGQRIAQ